MKKIGFLIILLTLTFSCSEDETIEPVDPSTEEIRVIPQLLPNLSQLNLFSGELSDLIPNEFAFIYNLNTPLYTDHSIKQRIIALPKDAKITALGDGLPDFPDNTVIAKTFYYNNDDRDPSLGQKIIETRILLKLNGAWQTGDYKWNAAQTEATLSGTSSTVPVTFIDSEGETNNINYRIPSNNDCISCHAKNNDLLPLGPKLRNLTKNNQLQQFDNSGYIENLDITSINALPDWQDTSYTLEERARAYIDVNCASCHIDGGSCATESILRMDFETPLNDSGIVTKKDDIDLRMQDYQNGYSMPLIGVTTVHAEGYNLVRAYINSL